MKVHFFLTCEEWHGGWRIQYELLFVDIYYHLKQSMMEESKSGQNQQLKRFNFFEVSQIQEQNDDPQNHPIKLNNISVYAVAMIGPRILILDKDSNRIIVFVKKIEGYWSPYSGTPHRMVSNDCSEDGMLLTYGEDVEVQITTSYLKLWRLRNVRGDYQSLTPFRTILVGQSGRPDKNISCMHFMRDMSLIILGDTKSHLLLFEDRSANQFDFKLSDRIMDQKEKEIREAKGVKRVGDTDVYFTMADSFYWFQNLSENKRVMQAQAEIIEVTAEDSILVTFKGDTRTIYEYKGGKEIRTWAVEGDKTILRQFRGDYLITALFEKRNLKNDTSEKYRVSIMDTKNQYIAYFETFSQVEGILASQENIVVVGSIQKGERMVYILTEKDNSFKIKTFFKKSFFNEAWRFAKNQNCQEGLLAEISRLHGDLLYSKNDLANAIKQYISTLGHVEPSYVIRKFLDVSQIDFLIEYLEKIHEKKLGKKEHTALLLNCYVKKKKIDNLSHFLSELSIESDLFDIETAIKVCKDLKHFDEAMKLAEQKNKHELLLKILIEDKKDYANALEHIKTKVDMEEKEKYIIEFGQHFMKTFPEKTIELIKLLVRAHSISQIIRGRERDFILTPEEKSVLEQLNFNIDELETLSVITFKKPDEYFRLFLTNHEDLQNFLNYLIREIPKLPHEQIVYHRLIEFYLEMIKISKERREEYEQKILEILRNDSRKHDNNHLLALFKMYDFDEGVITLCKKLGMREDLLNFYISKHRDTEILELCRAHGGQEVNLWIHALKYFVKPENNKELEIPSILQHLSLIPNLSPLPILAILSKNKNIQYHYIKDFFLAKLKQDREEIETDRDVVKKNMRLAEESRTEFRKLKTTAKPFLSNNCAQCQNGLVFPSIHFMCGHSFHEHCLGGDKQCSRCGYEARNMINRKEKYAEAAADQTKLFETLEERKGTGFEVIAEYLGRGLFKSL